MKSSARQRNAIEMAFRWRADDGPTLNAGLVACDFSGDPDQYCKETLYFFLFFQVGGGGPNPLSPPLDPHTYSINKHGKIHLIEKVQPIRHGLC